MGWNKTGKDLEKRLKRIIKTRNEKSIPYVFNHIGEKAVNWAKENKSYVDRTSNLRNSIGYAILHDGKIIKKTTRFHKRNVEMIEKIKTKINTDGWILIVYAGMEYGIYVENKGYVVLTGALENSGGTELADIFKKVLKEYDK